MRTCMHTCIHACMHALGLFVVNVFFLFLVIVSAGAVGEEASHPTAHHLGNRCVSVSFFSLILLSLFTLSFCCLLLLSPFGLFCWCLLLLSPFLPSAFCVGTLLMLLHCVFVSFSSVSFSFVSFRCLLLLSMSVGLLCVSCRLLYAFMLCLVLLVSPFRCFCLSPCPLFVCLLVPSLSVSLSVCSDGIHPVLCVGVSF